jgi:hypothetical protein
MNPDQLSKKRLIEHVSILAGIDPVWASAVAMVESSLGMNQKSSTGCRGVFQMSSIAMKDLLQEMEKNDDDLIDILCGIAFLKLLYKRHGSIEMATLRYCDPNDRHFYWDRVKYWMEKFDHD